jgi:hypothetical protein
MPETRNIYEVNQGFYAYETGEPGLVPLQNVQQNVKEEDKGADIIIVLLKPYQQAEN